MTTYDKILFVLAGFSCVGVIWLLWNKFLQDKKTKGLHEQIKKELWELANPPKYSIGKQVYIPEMDSHYGKREKGVLVLGYKTYTYNDRYYRSYEVFDGKTKMDVTA